MDLSKRNHWLIIAVAIIALIPRISIADDELRDRVTSYLLPGETPNSAIVELWMSNTNDIIAVSLPFKFAAGDSLAFDSLAIDEGRAKEFAVATPVYRSENKTLLLNLLWARDSTVQAPPIPPGDGALMRIYLSTPKAFPMKDFRMVSVQLPPENVLMYVVSTLNAVNPDFEVAKGAPPREWGEKAKEK